MSRTDTIILGIDPGLAITGYGLIRVNQQNDYHCIEHGVITSKSGLPDPERLQILFDQLSQLIHHHHPDSGAVENLFFQKNVKTAFSVGQARGVALLALAQANLPISEYNPNQVKQTVCGYGNASKIQVQKMVQTLLGLKELPKPDDAADALAVAICHVHHLPHQRLIRQA